MAEPRAFVCGHPIGHSRSPLIHRHWLARYAIAGSYEMIDVGPSDFPAFLVNFADRGFVGGNVTIPHKEAAYELVDQPDKAASIIGAVNTLWLEDGAVRGGNSDWIGFAANLDDRAPTWRKAATATLLGAGGGARGVVHALLEAGIVDIRVVNRTISRARELVDRFGPRLSAHGWDAAAELFADTDVLINTTSIGMAGDAGELPSLTVLPSSAIVTDLVYVPLETPLLAAARQRGLATVDGLGMLLHQAVPGFARWFGRTPEVTAELRSLVLSDIEAAKK